MLLTKQQLRVIYNVLAEKEINYSDLDIIAPEFRRECLKKYDWDSREDLKSFFDDCYVESIKGLWNPKWANIVSKSDPEWQKIPYLEETFIYEDIYTLAKKSLKDGFLLTDFDSYSEKVGPIAINKKYREKYKNVKQRADLDIVNVDEYLIVRSDILTIFVDIFMGKGAIERKNILGLVWPLCKQLASEELRALPDYPLATPIDILKIDYIASFIYDFSKRTEFMKKIALSFFGSKKEDITKWAKTK